MLPLLPCTPLWPRKPRCWPHAFWQSCTRGRLGALSNDACPIADNEAPRWHARFCVCLADEVGRRVIYQYSTYEEEKHQKKSSARGGGASATASASASKFGQWPGNRRKRASGRPYRPCFSHRRRAALRHSSVRCPEFSNVTRTRAPVQEDSNPGTRTIVVQSGLLLYTNYTRTSKRERCAEPPRISAPPRERRLRRWCHGSLLRFMTFLRSILNRFGDRPRRGVFTQSLHLRASARILLRSRGAARPPALAHGRTRGSRRGRTSA